MEYHELLSTEETNALLTRAQAGDSGAVDLLVRHNQRLIISIANRYFSSGYGGDQELDDLVQWGNIGLLRAIQKWDGMRGYCFSTYAVHWINGVIRRYASMRGTPLGMTHREMLRLGAIRRARSDLDNGEMKEPDPEAIAEQAGMAADYVAEWLPALDYLVSLDNPNGHDDDSPFLFERIGIEAESLDDTVERIGVFAEIREKISRLPDRQREVITRRYLVDPPHNFSKISVDLEISYQRVQQIEQEALCSLRATCLNSVD